MDRWGLATIDDGQGELSVRFNIDKRGLISKQLFPKEFVLTLAPLKTNNLDEYLQSLSEIEDFVLTQFKYNDSSELFLVVSGADYRDVHIAISESPKSYSAILKPIVKRFPDRLNIESKDIDLSLYRLLIESLSEM